MAAITLKDINKRYGDGFHAVKDVSLDIADGEFVILVGPSGCGKSTMLNMVAGLEDISSGELRIDGQRVNEKAPKDRDIAMVFQSYALYPHMSVRENMAFPLRLAKTPDAEVRAKVHEAAEILDLTGHLDRKPGNLSGGQRQRVAMGRAIVRSPKAFLMDEPLSNLDAKLRVQMRTSVSKLQKQLGTTTLYVTHDQTEAMTLGDRVVVLRGGTVQQIGSPQHLYDHPENLFVAGFIGSPAMNFVPGTIADGSVRSPLGTVALPERHRAAVQAGSGGREVIVGIRPEHFEDAALVDAAARERGGHITVTIDVLESMGSDAFAHFGLEQATVIQSAELAELAADSGTAEAGESAAYTARLSAATTARSGEQAELWFDADKLQLFDPQSGQNLTAAS
jgi:multiple sugar transport system ATP-binding protein